MVSFTFNGDNLFSACVLKYELDDGIYDNPYGIAEVTTMVRIAQYFAAIIGVLREWGCSVFLPFPW